MKLSVWRPPVLTYRWQCDDCMEGDVMRGPGAARRAMREAKRHIEADRSESCMVEVVRIMASVEPEAEA